MKTLHQELTDIILRAMVHNDPAHEAAGAVIAKIVERLPKKKPLLPLSTDYRYGKSTQFGIQQWNLYHDTLKDLLRKEN